MNEKDEQTLFERLRDEQLRAQATAAAVQGVNHLQEVAKRSLLEQQENGLRQALGEMSKLREILDSPERILGSAATKHGEIAEWLEVYGRNAKALVLGKTPTASIVVDRFAPEDYVVDGVAVQSKFINGLNNNLERVIDHFSKYPDWGAQGEYYHIPRDHLEQITEVVNGGNSRGLNARTISAIREKVANIEQVSGRPFHEVVRPSSSTYSEVMPGAIEETLDRREAELRTDNEARKSVISDESAPSLGKGVETAAAAAAVVGAFTFAAGVYAKWRGGKNPFHGEFTADDWKDLGVASGRNAAKAGVSAFTIYCLTNFAKSPAPLAGAVVGAAANVHILVQSSRAGDISTEELLELAPLACLDAAATFLAASAGQVLIPIPVVGMLLGAVAARMCLKFLPNQETYIAARAKLEKYYEAAKAQIRETESTVLVAIFDEYDRLGDLTEAAFDFSRNYALLLQASVLLAEGYDVPSEMILRSEKELDSFMNG